MTHLFTRTTTAFIFGMQRDPIQRMLDFDYIIKREPSITGIINPGATGKHKCFFGKDEIQIPLYPSIDEAAKKHPGTTVMVNFASFRSAYESSREALKTKTIKTIAIIAEGIPERLTLELIDTAQKLRKTIIGPATVGGITAGAFRIGNTAGTIKNIIDSKLYRPGSVGFVSKSGGLSNEMFKIISGCTDGVYEGIAIGGDRFPGTTLFDHILRYEKNPKIKMMVLLGEVGGADELGIARAIQRRQIRKPVVAWVTGTSAEHFPSGIQFGHASAKARTTTETATAKNKVLKKAGAIVPRSFNDFGTKIGSTYKALVTKGKIKPREETITPQPLPKIRRPTSIVSSISDDRGEEVTYNGVAISTIIKENQGLGEVIALLWFKKKLPKFATEFIEIILKIVADHGPAVSGAHNAIVTARAGKDIISSLVSGLLTIGPRFGGAIDDAAHYFKKAHDEGTRPEEFVQEMKSKNILIPGIGHKIKSIKNPDTRVTLLKEYGQKHFTSLNYLNYALEVEKLTTAKKDNLILNVDGAIAVLFLDLLKSSKQFSKKEIDEFVELGYLNGLFALGRSIGILGHIFDQKRMRAPLYRHPWDDILYV